MSNEFFSKKDDHITLLQLTHHELPVGTLANVIVYSVVKRGLLKKNYQFWADHLHEWLNRFLLANPNLVFIDIDNQIIVTMPLKCQNFVVAVKKCFLCFQYVGSLFDITCIFFSSS